MPKTNVCSTGHASHQYLENDSGWTRKRCTCSCTTAFGGHLKDLLADVNNQREGEDKSGDGDDKQAGDKEEMGVAGSCPWKITHIQELHSHGFQKAKGNMVDWQKTVEIELKDKGLKKPGHAVATSEDRTAWKQRAYSQILH